MSVTQVAEHFRQDGFAIVEQILAPDQLDEVSQRLNHYIQVVAPTARKQDVLYEQGSRSIKHLSGLDRYDPYWQSFLRCREIVEQVEACLGTAVEPVGSEVFYKPAQGGTAAPGHQDNAYVHLNPAEACAVWIALDDATVENGCICYARGSHQLGNLPHVKGSTPPFSKALVTEPDPQKHPFFPAVMKAGDAVIHHCLTVHRSSPNTTDRNRRGLVLNYKGANAAVDESAHADHITFVQQLHDQNKRM